MLTEEQNSTAERITDSGQWRSPVLLGGVTSVLLVLAFHLSIYNRYLPIQEGWFSYYGYLMQHGKVPYRDFYFFTQPISLFISRIIVAFGDKFIYFRYYGVLERTILTGELYYLLSRYFTVPAAVCATVASTFLFTCYATDAFFSFLYTCLLFFIAALIFLHRAVIDARHRRTNLIITGVLCGASFFSKQSNGLFAFAALFVALVILNESFNSASKQYFHLLLGTLLPALPIGFWLWWGRAWPQYLDQVYRGAAASKGSLASVLFGFYSRAFEPFALISFAVLSITLIRLIRKRGLAEESPVYSGHKLRYVTLLAICSAVFAGMGTAPHGFHPAIVFLSFVISHWLVRVVFYITAAGFIWVLYKRLASHGVGWTKGYELPIMLAVAGFFWTYTCGSSYMIEEQSAIPSVSLILALSYDKLKIRHLNTGRKLVVWVTASIILFSIWHKWSIAFNWQSWLQPMSVEGKHSHWEPISDYSIDSNIAGMYDTALDDIARNVKDGEQIVTFPFMPMFNVISRHPQPTFAAVHYWDVCPDYIAIADAIRVRKARPRMIIHILMQDKIWNVHEDGFRLGRPSGQREFQKVIDDLTSSGDYKLLHVYLTPFYQDPVCVWLRVGK